MSELKVSAVLDRIRALRQLSREKEIIKTAQSALASFPEEPDLWSYLASAHKQLEQYEDALRAAEKACSLPNATSFPFRIRAGVLTSLGRSAEALEVARAAVVAEPDSTLAFLKLWSSAGDMGETAEAARALERALELEPDSAEVLRCAGQHAHAHADYTRSEELFRRALVIDPANPWLHLGLGETLAGRGDVEDAILSYRRAISINPRVESFHSSLGRALVKAGRTGDAIAAFEAGMAAFPRSMSFVQGKLAALKAELRFDDARALAEETVRKRPDDSEAWIALAYLLDAPGTTDDAIAAASHAVALCRSAWELRALSSILFDAHRYGDALEQAREAIALEGGSTPAWTRAFWAALALGDFDEAHRFALRLTELEPHDGEGHACVLHCERARPDRSQESVDRAASELKTRFPDAVATWDELARHALMTRDPAAIVECRERVQGVLAAGRSSARETVAARRFLHEADAYDALLREEWAVAKEHLLLSCKGGEPDKCGVVCLLGLIAARTGEMEVARRIQRREFHGKRRARRCADPHCLTGRLLDDALGTEH